MYKIDGKMKGLLFVLRAVFGGVFIYSGFVKAVDPWGTAYKIEEYLTAFAMNGLLDMFSWLPIAASVFLCCLEFMIGVIMFFGFFRKFSKWISAIIMCFFTILTFVDALTNRVSDCGCFGDAITLTNWQTFWKNIVLDVILLGVFLLDRKVAITPSKINSKLITSVFAVLVVCFSVYNTVYEPVIDFRPWKIGNQMVPVGEDVKPPISYATYRNNSTGEEKEFNMEELMAEYETNKTFDSVWTFVNSRVENTNEVAAEGFSLQALGLDEDNTFDILSDTASDLYMITTYDIRKASEKGMEKALEFVREAVETDMARAMIVTASNLDVCVGYQERFDVKDIPFYSSDDKSIKTILRSNPGVIKISKGRVADKWSWRSLPDEDEYFQKNNK